MIDILSKLPFVNDTGETPAVEIDEAEAKKARIQFHRDHVRNGPAKFKDKTSGQIRRERKRALNAMTKRARKTQVHDYFAQQRFIATLRGNLQAVGILPYATEGFQPPEAMENRALRWLVATFDGDDLEARLKDAVATYTRLTMPVKR